MGQYHIIQKQLVLYFTIFHYISLKHESAKDLQKAFVTLWEFFNHWHRRNGHFVFISFLNVWSPFEWPVFMGAGQSQVGDQMCRGTAASAAVPRCFQFSFHIFHIFHIVFGSFFLHFLRFGFSFLGLLGWESEMHWRWLGFRCPKCWHFRAEAVAAAPGQVQPLCQLWHFWMAMETLGHIQIQSSQSGSIGISWADSFHTNWTFGTLGVWMVQLMVQ